MGVVRIRSLTSRHNEQRLAALRRASPSCSIRRSVVPGHELSDRPRPDHWPDPDDGRSGVSAFHHRPALAGVRPPDSEGRAAADDLPRGHRWPGRRGSVALGICSTSDGRPTSGTSRCSSVTRTKSGTPSAGDWLFVVGMTVLLMAIARPSVRRSADLAISYGSARVCSDGKGQRRPCNARASSCSRPRISAASARR